jgi:hypothetical protein
VNKLPPNLIRQVSLQGIASPAKCRGKVETGVDSIRGNSTHKRLNIMQTLIYLALIFSLFLGGCASPYT